MGLVIENQNYHNATPSEGHFVVWNSFKEFIRNSQGRLTSVVLWTDSGKTQKIREVIFARDTYGRVVTITKNAYDAGGVLAATITSTVNRPINTITSITIART